MCYECEVYVSVFRFVCAWNNVSILYGRAVVYLCSFFSLLVLIKATSFCEVQNNIRSNSKSFFSLAKKDTNKQLNTQESELFLIETGQNWCEKSVWPYHVFSTHFSRTALFILCVYIFVVRSTCCSCFSFLLLHFTKCK